MATLGSNMYPPGTQGASKQASLLLSPAPSLVLLEAAVASTTHLAWQLCA
jgi:hypothetical protein